MGSSFFVDKKLHKTLVKDLKKRKEIEDTIDKLQKDLEKTDEKIDDDLDEFYAQVDDSTVLSTLKYYENRSKADKKKNLAKEIEDKYKNKNLIIEDALNLIDWYELMCDENNNKI